MAPRTRNQQAGGSLLAGSPQQPHQEQPPQQSMTPGSVQQRAAQQAQQQQQQQQFQQQLRQQHDARLSPQHALQQAHPDELMAAHDAEGQQLAAFAQAQLQSTPQHTMPMMSSHSQPMPSPHDYSPYAHHHQHHHAHAMSASQSAQQLRAGEWDAGAPSQPPQMLDLPVAPSQSSPTPMQRAMSSAAMPYSFRTASRSLGQAAEAASAGGDGFLRLSGLPRRPFAHSHSHSSSTASASGTCTPSLSRSLSPSSSITSSFTIATAPSVAAASLAGKSKTRLSNTDRKRICEFATEHPELRQETIGTHFGVERSTVSKILKEKEKWLNIDEEREGHIVKHRNARFPKVEIVLTGWIQANGGPLSDRALMEKAAAIAREQGETTFRASAGWVVKFRERLRRNTGIGSPIAPRVPSSAAPTPSPAGTSSLGRIPAPSPAGPPAAPLGAVLNEHDARRAALEQADQQGLSASAAAAAAEAAAASAAQARAAAAVDSIAARGQITPRAAKRRADLMLQGALPMPASNEQFSKRLRSRAGATGARTSTPPYTSSGSGSGLRSDAASAMHMQSHDDTHMQGMASMLGPAFEQHTPHGTYGHAEMHAAISPEQQHGQPLKDVAATSLGLAAAGYTAASPNPFAPPRVLGTGARLSNSLSGTNGDSSSAFDTSASACTHDDSGVAGLVSVSSTSSPGGGNERMDEADEASPCHSSSGRRSSEEPVTVHEAQRSVDTIIRFLREHPNMARRDEEFLLWGQLKGYLNATLEIENQNGGGREENGSTPRLGN